MATPDEIRREANEKNAERAERNSYTSIKTLITSLVDTAAIVNSASKIANLSKTLEDETTTDPDHWQALYALISLSIIFEVALGIALILQGMTNISGAEDDNAKKTKMKTLVDGNRLAGVCGVFIFVLNAVIAGLEGPVTAVTPDEASRMLL